MRPLKGLQFWQTQHTLMTMRKRIVFLIPNSRHKQESSWWLGFISYFGYDLYLWHIHKETRLSNFEWYLFFWVRGSLLWLDHTNNIWIFRPYHPINFFAHLFSIKSAFHSFYSKICSTKCIHKWFWFNFAKYISILFKNNLESNIYYFRLETIVSSTKM